MCEKNISALWRTMCAATEKTWLDAHYAWLPGSSDYKESSPLSALLLPKEASLSHVRDRKM
ncbi:MAG: hypothetical protein IKP19_05625 [Oscillospiraceae bacterium]|nr:hypothetical protein [Oscillospiraceae bacterium]